MKKEHTRVLRRISAMLLIILIFTVCATGCDSADVFNSGLESGFNVSSGTSDESVGIHSAYKSNKTRFDINDVTLDFYYGIEFTGSPEFQIQHGISVPDFELYFSNEDGNEYLIKRVEENLVSGKYKCERNPCIISLISKYKFNHSESITIPKELFANERGKIVFFLRGNKDYFCIDETNGYLTGVTIYYKVVGDNVILSERYDESF